MPPQRRNTSRLKKIFAALFLLALFFFTTTVYFFLKARSSDTGSEEERAEVRSEDMIERVAAHMILPTDEKPTVATVSDPEQLKTHVFFEKTKRGDIVLIYTGARKAILYDPVADRIVEAAPLAIEPSE